MGKGRKPAVCYESNLVWGPAGAVIAIVLTVVAAMKKDLRFLLVLAWPFASVAGWAILRTAQLRPLVRRLLTAVISLLCAAALLSLHFWLAPASVNTAAEPPHDLPAPIVPQPKKASSAGQYAPTVDTESATVLVQCDNVMQPVTWDNKTLQVLQPGAVLVGGPAGLTSATGKPRKWPEGESFPLFNRLYECRLTNYGTSPIFALRTEFKFELHEALAVSDNLGSRKSGALVSTENHPIAVPVLEPDGGSFVFYIYNTSRYFVSALKPAFATVELAVGEQRKRIRLKQSAPGEPTVFFLSPKT